MNPLFNSAPYKQQPTYKQSMASYGDNNNHKHGMSLQPESLFSMAMYDVESTGGQQLQVEPLPIRMPAPAAPAFHPVDEYKDMSLKQLLDLSDDYLFGDDDDEEQPDAASMLNPIPLNVPVGHNVAQAAARAAVQAAYAEPVLSINSNSSSSSSRSTIPHSSMDNLTPLDSGLDMPSFLDSSSNNNNNNNNIVPMMSTSGPVPPKKRRREVSDDDASEQEDLNHEGRFRPYQAGQWNERFTDLKTYSEANGNCLVPHTYKQNLPLARWVKRQRYQFKLMSEGKSSTMTDERVQALGAIGFIWDSQGAAWGERLEELKEFRSVYMHSNVPSNYSENPQLATWVKCQRRQYKLHMEQKPSNMTAQRIRDLETIGFEWLLRSYKKSRPN